MRCSPSFAGSIGRTGRASCWSSRTPNARSSLPGEPMCLNSDGSSWKARPSALSPITRCRLPISAAARRSGAAAASMRPRQADRRIEAVEQRRRTMQTRSMAAVASSAPKLAEPFQYAFRNTSDEGYMFDRVMRALKQKNLPIATAAIAYATDDVISKVMGENVLPGIMKKAGTDVKLSVTFQSQAFDFSAQVSQLVGQPTDLIGVGSGPDPATRLVQELRRQGHKGRLVAGSTIADPELGRQMGKAGDGTTIPTTFYGELNDRAKALQAAFAKRAKAAGLDRTTAAQFDAATYDIVLFYADAMKQAKVTGAPSNLAAERTAINDELRKMKDFPALEGAISFGSNGDALKPVYVIQLQDGKWTLIGQFPPGT